MRTVSTLVFVALCGLTFGQTLPPVPPSPEAINLRLERAAQEMERAADAREVAMYAALFGGAMTAIAYNDKPSAGNIVGFLTISAVYGFTLKGAGHDRRAARLLHGQ